MKKTILVSIGTTLATMFVVMMLMHLCSSHCGQSRCGKNESKCSSSYSHGGEHGKCAATAGCESKTKCSSKKSCKKGSKSCSSKSKCSKKKSCDKGDWNVTTKDGVTTKTYKSDDGEKVIKKVIKVEVEEEE